MFGPFLEVLTLNLVTFIADVQMHTLLGAWNVITSFLKIRGCIVSWCFTRLYSSENKFGTFLSIVNHEKGFLFRMCFCFQKRGNSDIRSYIFVKIVG